MTANLYDLLPPNATDLERDFSRSTSSLVRAGGPVPIIRTAKRTNIPDDVVPWLIYEYGLGELLPYLDDQRLILSEGVLWQRIRGTPESVSIALGWIGLDAWVEEPEAGTTRWSEYMIGMVEPRESFQTIAAIVGISRISSPVRSRLQRIYSIDWDFRRFVLDDSLLSSGALLSDHSGVRLGTAAVTGLIWDFNPWREVPWGEPGDTSLAGWPQISYGRTVETLIEPDSIVGLMRTDLAENVAYPETTFRLSHSIIDDDWHVLNYPAAVTTVAV